MDEKKNKKTITKKTFKYLLSKEVPKEKLDDNSSFGYYDNQIKTFTELLHKKENNNGISQQTPDKPTGFWGD